MIDRRPHVVMAHVFIVFVTVGHLCEGADPVDQTSVGHAAVPDDTTGACSEGGGATVYPQTGAG